MTADPCLQDRRPRRAWSTLVSICVYRIDTGVDPCIQDRRCDYCEKRFFDDNKKLMRRKKVYTTVVASAKYVVEIHRAAEAQPCGRHYNVFFEPLLSLIATQRHTKKGILWKTLFYKNFSCMGDAMFKNGIKKICIWWVSILPFCSKRRFVAKRISEFYTSKHQGVLILRSFDLQFVKNVSLLLCFNNAWEII